jgi:GDP-D-mannose dehydratase
LQGNYSKARESLGWLPKVNLQQLAQMMVAADLAEAHREIR